MVKCRYVNVYAFVNYNMFICVCLRVCMYAEAKREYQIPLKHESKIMCSLFL